MLSFLRVPSFARHIHKLDLSDAKVAFLQTPHLMDTLLRMPRLVSVRLKSEGWPDATRLQAFIRQLNEKKILVEMAELGSPQWPWWSIFNSNPMVTFRAVTSRRLHI